MLTRESFWGAIINSWTMLQWFTGTFLFPLGFMILVVVNLVKKISKRMNTTNIAGPVEKERKKTDRKDESGAIPTAVFCGIIGYGALIVTLKEIGILQVSLSILLSSMVFYILIKNPKRILKISSFLVFLIVSGYAITFFRYAKSFMENSVAL